MRQWMSPRISVRWPFLGYGCVPGTLGEDGDPFDALVLVQEPARAGSRRRSG
jgi:inorganic pyrophosphatase